MNWSFKRKNGTAESNGHIIDMRGVTKVYDTGKIQVEALRNNSLLDEGIELTYRFASPGNKRVTGPLVRFTAMVRSPPYDRLLNHRSARYGPLAVSGDEAYQRVIVTDAAGEEVVYHWVLSRQSEGQYKDCWMTDGVLPVQHPGERNGLIPA